MTTANELPADIAAALEEMRNELESFRLEVILIPQRIRTNEGGCVRVAVSKNAPWYRRLCARYASSRRRKNSAFDTRIKRRGTLRVLSALCEGKPTASQYAPELLAEARQRTRHSATASRTQHPAQSHRYAAAVAVCENENPF